MIKKMKAKKINIPLSTVEKPTADILLRRIDTNLVNLEIRRSNEYISLGFTDSEVVALRKAVNLYFGY